VSAAGFEPATYALKVGCSALIAFHLISRARIFNQIAHCELAAFERIRDVWDLICIVICSKLFSPLFAFVRLGTCRFAPRI
jgi:hypothetical protein